MAFFLILDFLFWIGLKANPVAFCLSRYASRLFSLTLASRPSPSRGYLSLHPFCRILDRVHNVLIARAATEISVKRVANFILRWLRITHEQLMRSENHSRSAETALKPVTFPKGLLNRMELLSLRQTFDRQNISAIRLHRKHRAGLHRGIVKHDRACPADTGFATDVGTRQPYEIANKMNQ
jgi:hypothetical protein